LSKRQSSAFCAAPNRGEQRISGFRLFIDIAITGGGYLCAVNRDSIAVVAAKMDKEAMEQTPLPIIRAAASRTLPDTRRPCADHGTAWFRI